MVQDVPNYRAHVEARAQRPLLVLTVLVVLAIRAGPSGGDGRCRGTVRRGACLTPDENFELIPLVTKDMEQIRRRSAMPFEHAYSMSIRPGETKTQRIEMPGLTLGLVVTMSG